MNSVAVFVGLDYAQNPVRVCFMDGAGQALCNRNVANSAEAIIALAERFGPVRSAAIEACCGAADLADELVERGGWTVHMAHPGFVARMKQNPDKTDYSDAQVVADLERVGYLPRVWIAPKALRELRVLTTLPGLHPRGKPWGAGTRGPSFPPPRPPTLLPSLCSGAGRVSTGVGNKVYRCGKGSCAADALGRQLRSHPRAKMGQSAALFEAPTWARVTPTLG